MNAAARHSVLIVDDDRRLTAMLAELLDTEGYDCLVAANGARGLLLCEEHRPDLVVLDVMMPGEDGVRTLEQLRAKSAVPVIMLTALGDEDDRIRGLEAGADDYVAKPFAARELMLRIRAILKRSRPTDGVPQGGVREAGPLRLDADRQVAEVNGEALTLTGTEWRILSLLVEKSGAVVTREYLSRYALGRELLPDDRTLDTHLSNLRRKLAESGAAGCAIRTVRGAGYRLTVA